MVLLAAAAAPAAAQSEYRAPYVIPDGYAQGLGDLDGDGDLDVVVALGAFLTPLLNDGAGHLAPGTPTPLGPEGPAGGLDGVLADLDGDLDLDLVARRTSGASGAGLLVYRWNAASGAFEPPVAYAFAVTLGTFDAADADGDGDAEVAVAWGSAFGPSHYRWLDWNGTALVEGPLLTLPSTLGGIAAGDVTGDGLAEILATTAFGAPRLFVLATHAGAPSVLADLPVGSVGLGDVRVADREGDGDLDILVTSAEIFDDGLGLQWVVPQPGGGFAPGPVSFVPDAGLETYAVGDWDGDGLADLLRESALHVADASGAFGLALPHPYVPAPFGVADLSGDGHADLVGLGRLLFGDGTLALLADAATGPTAARPLDLDGDGDLDVYDHAGSETAVGAWRNDATGAFTLGAAELVGLAADELLRGALLPADLDGDGRDDLLRERFVQPIPLGPATFASTGLWVAAGDAAWVEAHAATAGVPLGLSAHFAENRAVDLDLDGDLDVIAVDTAWQNDGTGRFDAPVALFAGSLRDVADLDLDGDPDLLAVLGQSQVPTVAVLRNAGGLAFVPELLDDTVHTLSPQLLDVDGDGAPDAVYQRLGLVREVRWARNLGAAFGIPRAIGGSTPATFAARFSIADVDRDGFPDVVASEAAAAGYGLTVAYLRDAPPALTFGAARRWDTGPLLGAHDVDQDGDVDLLGNGVWKHRAVAGPQAPRVRQYGVGAIGTGGYAPLAGLAGVPAPGASVENRLVGGPGGAAGLLVLGTAEAFLPGVPVPGLTGLVDAPVLVLPLVLSGAPGTPGAGEFALPLAVPPELAGAHYFEQFALVDPAGPSGLTLSNALEIRFGP